MLSTVPGATVHPAISGFVLNALGHWPRSPARHCSLHRSLHSHPAPLPCQSHNSSCSTGIAELVPFMDSYMPGCHGYQGCGTGNRSTGAIGLPKWSVKGSLPRIRGHAHSGTTGPCPTGEPMSFGRNDTVRHQYLALSKDSKTGHNWLRGLDNGHKCQYGALRKRHA